MADPRVTGTAPAPLPTSDTHIPDSALTKDRPTSPAANRPPSDRNLDGALMKNQLVANVPPPTPKAGYPVSDTAIATQTARTQRLSNELPTWTIQDKKFFLAKENPWTLKPGQSKFTFPSDAEVANDPMVRRFDENTRGAETYFNEAQEFFKMAGDYLHAGDKATAQEYFDQGLALERLGSTMKNRNEQWLQLRRDHRDQALDKYVDDMKDWGINSALLLGADAKAAELAFSGLSKFYQAFRLGKTAENAERMAQLEKLLANPEKLKNAKPETLVQLSGDLKVGLTTPEAEQLINTAKNLPQFQIAESQALTRDILQRLPEDDAARALLTNDRQLANTRPEALMRAANITKAEADKLILGADLRLNREIDQMSWKGAVDTLRARGDRGSLELADQIENFTRTLEAHQNMMNLYGQRLPGIVQKARNMSLEELQKTYGLKNLDEAALLKQQLNDLPEKVSFPAHDLWGPAGKNRTSIARAIGRDRRAFEDPVVADAVRRHGLQFDHHNSRDPLSRLESGFDRVDAMRDPTRIYRPFSMSWDDIAKETDKLTDDSRRVLEKFAQTEVRRMEEAGLVRHVQTAPNPVQFTPGR